MLHEQIAAWGYESRPAIIGEVWSIAPPMLHAALLSTHPVDLRVNVVELGKPLLHTPDAADVAVAARRLRTQLLEAARKDQRLIAYICHRQIAYVMKHLYQAIRYRPDLFDSPKYPLGDVDSLSQYFNIRASDFAYLFQNDLLVKAAEELDTDRCSSIRVALMEDSQRLLRAEFIRWKLNGPGVDPALNALCQQLSDEVRMYPTGDAAYADNRAATRLALRYLADVAADVEREMAREMPHDALSSTGTP
jgi:hypothetical protein